VVWLETDFGGILTSPLCAKFQDDIFRVMILQGGSNFDFPILHGSYNSVVPVIIISNYFKTTNAEKNNN